MPWKSENDIHKNYVKTYTGKNYNFVYLNDSWCIIKINNCKINVKA